MDIWKKCSGPDHLRPLRETAIRIVEAQEQVATRHLVDSLDEQRLLEEMLDASKPAIPESATRRHYLIQTAFRYPPLPHGSRFGDRMHGGIFYGSLTLRTALAECAYYRLVLLAGMETPPPGELLLTQHTSFRVEVRTKRGIRLDHPPFDRHRVALTCPDSYAATQRVGLGMRNAGVTAFVCRSARDVPDGRNVGILDAAAIVSTEPRAMQGWNCFTTADEVSFLAAHGAGRFSFPRRSFLIRGKLPAPAV